MWGGGVAMLFPLVRMFLSNETIFFFYLWKTNYRYIHIMRATHDLIKGTHVMSKYKHVHVYDICKILHMFDNLFNSSVQREKTNTYVLFICIAHLLAKGSLALILRYDLC